MSFAQSLQASGSFGEVVQGPQEQNAVDGRIGRCQLLCLAQGCGKWVVRLRRRGFPCLLNMQRDGFDQMDLVTEIGQYPSVRTGTTSDVEQTGRWGRKVALKKLKSAYELEAWFPVSEQPTLLQAEGIVEFHVLSRGLIRHEQIVPPARYISVATRATRFRRWLAQLLDYVLLHGPRLP